MVNHSRFGKLGFIVANSHPALGQDVATHLGIRPLLVESKPFDNGELDVRRLCDVSGKDICIFSSLHAGYDTIKELRLIIRTMKSANRIFGVFPFVRDGKSDHKKRFGETDAYKDTALEISSSGLDMVAIFDQHSAQHPGFYDTTHYRLRDVHHIYMMRILIEHARSHSGSFDGVLAPDAGSYKRNEMIAGKLGKPVSFVNKKRDPYTRLVDPEKSAIIGDVKGQRVIAFDDMCQGGGTIEMCARIARNKGVKSIAFYIVHNDFTPNTLKVLNPLLSDGTIGRIYILETIPLRDRELWHPNLVVLSPAKFIAKVIRTIHTEGHMRKLFLEI